MRTAAREPELIRAGDRGKSHSLRDDRSPDLTEPSTVNLSTSAQEGDHEDPTGHRD